MDEGDDFLRRIGNIHHALHVSGQEVLQRTLKTIVEMLTDRGHESIEVSPEPMQEIRAGRPVIRCSGVDVFFHTEDRVGVKFARTIVEQTTAAGKQCLCISIEGPTAFTKHEFQSRDIQFLTCKSLFVNITHHCLVPRHRLVVDYDGPVAKKYLPILLQSDPVVQYFNWPAGGVVEIERMFAGSEPIHYFRLIQESS